jgi:uncharacterized membrane protein
MLSSGRAHSGDGRTLERRYHMDPNQPSGQQYAPNQAPSSQQWGPTSLGLEANIAAGLGYLIPIIGVIFFFAENKNRYVKFNGAQATLLAIAGAIFGFLWLFVSILGSAIAAVSGGNNPGWAILAALGICGFSLVGLGLFGLQIWGIIVGFTGQYVKFPVIGQIAEQWAGGPP